MSFFDCDKSLIMINLSDLFCCYSIYDRTFCVMQQYRVYHPAYHFLHHKKLKTDSNPATLRTSVSPVIFPLVLRLPNVLN